MDKNMTDNELKLKLNEWKETRNKIEPLQTKMDSIKSEVKDEMMNRKIESFSFDNLVVDMVHKVQPKMDKKKLIEFLSTTEKYKGTTKIPDDFFLAPTISDYPQLKEIKN